VDHLHRSQSTANALQDQLAATRAELVQARQDLQASRSFVSTEASDDGKTLVDMLSVLNQKIDEFAYVVGDLVPPQMGEAYFTPPKTEKGLADMKSLETLGGFAIRNKLIDGRRAPIWDSTLDLQASSGRSLYGVRTCNRQSAQSPPQ
jgi:hypothetical protein